MNVWWGWRALKASRDAEGTERGGAEECLRDIGGFPSIYPFCDALLVPLSRRGGTQKWQNGLSFEPLVSPRSIHHGLFGVPADSDAELGEPETCVRFALWGVVRTLAYGQSHVVTLPVSSR